MLHVRTDDEDEGIEFLSSGWSLCEESIHHPPVHVGEPVVAALELERQPGVVNAEAMQHRRVRS